jgi:hypothetical protein
MAAALSARQDQQDAGNAKKKVAFENTQLESARASSSRSVVTKAAHACDVPEGNGPSRAELHMANSVTKTRATS